MMLRRLKEDVDQNIATKEETIVEVSFIKALSAKIFDLFFHFVCESHVKLFSMF